MSCLRHTPVKAINRDKLYFQSDVTLIKSWFVNGKHYSHTLEDWLRLQDANSKEGLSVLEKDAKCKGLDPSEGRKAFYRYVAYEIIKFLFINPLLTCQSGSECFTSLAQSSLVYMEEKSESYCLLV